MKVEQACRFRTEEGYGITGQSAGFDQAQAKTLGELFNDSMNPIFPKLATSVLTCAVRGQYAFYARSTYRSHSGREAIFTHSYILPADMYVTAMQQMPQRLLAVPMSEFMKVQTGDVNMQTVEFPSEQYGELSLDELIKKYNLTPGRYAKLLMGAYEAMTSNRSLRLSTNSTIEDTEKIVRELVYCIVEGLLPTMKGKMTFSSGADTRMNVSVIHADGRPGQSDDLIFGVEDDRRTNIRARDELTAEVFQALGTADHETRRELLQKMEDWLREITNVENGLSVLLISAAYCYCCGKPMKHDVQVALFRNFTKIAGKSVSVHNVNNLLTDLVETMVKDHRVSTKALSNIAEWYLMDSSEGFREAANQAMMMASTDVRVALVDAAIGLPANQNVYELVTVLLGLIPPEDPALDEELREALVRWIIRENLDRLAVFCDVLMEEYPAVKLVELAVDILYDAQGKTLNDAQIALLIRAMDRIAKEPKTRPFSREEMELIEDHIAEFSESNLAALAEYILYVQLGVDLTETEQVKYLIQVGQERPALKEPLETVMQKGTEVSRRYALLWERYRAETVFTENTAGADIPMLLKQYNTFRNPMGAFEEKAVKRWIAFIKEKLSQELKTVDSVPKMADWMDMASDLLKQSAQLEGSQEMRNTASKFMVNEFWGNLSIRQIVRYCGKDVKIDRGFEQNERNSQFKLPLWRASARVVVKGEDTSELIRLVKWEMPQLVRERNMSLDDLYLVQNEMFTLAKRVVKKHGVVLWDLMLLNCWVKDDEYNYGELRQTIERLEGWLEEKKVSRPKPAVGKSILLESSAVRSEIIKKLDSGLGAVPVIAQLLVADLKNYKAGLRRSGSTSGFSRNESKRTTRSFDELGGSYTPAKRPPARTEQKPASGSKSKDKANQFTYPESPQKESKGILEGLFDKVKKRK